jgi:hypothetical protein
MTVTEHAETMSQDILRRLCVPVRDQATAQAAEHGVSTHVVVHMPTSEKSQAVLFTTLQLGQLPAGPGSSCGRSGGISPAGPGASRSRNSDGSNWTWTPTIPQPTTVTPRAQRVWH